MRTNEATEFERKYVQSDRKTTCYVELKPKRVGFFNGGGGQNIRPAIPGGVVVTEETPKMKARRLAREDWFAKRTWTGGSQGWVLMEDDSEDDYDNGLDPARTHVIGGVVDHGTHTTGVCSDECWCKEGEEE